MTAIRPPVCGLTTQDTAIRDIKELIDLGALQKGESGECSTSYALVEV